MKLIPFRKKKKDKNQNIWQYDKTAKLEINRVMEGEIVKFKKESSR